MSIRSRNDLITAVERLPETVTFQGRSYKKPWLRWLSEYEDPSRTTPDRSAQFIYNALNAAEWIVWLAAASGVEQGLVESAASAIDRRKLRQTQAAVIRDILPWELVADYLDHPRGRANSDDDAPDHLDAIYRTGTKQTIKQTLIEARLGQGQFRANVAKRWNGQCAVTGCSIVPLLRASHIKPWAKSSNRDRLNPANGILLAAHVDALFDCGLISFGDDGAMLVSGQIADDIKLLIPVQAAHHNEMMSPAVTE